ncbi:MAG: proline racemase family protein [Eubacteriales bacterium]|nr:proline racemase family protein [Eubacteriales bacterium]MDY3333111.1 proline racemase family protein [Gallibacter sp.]
MNLNPQVNFDKYEAQLQVVDCHTVGEFCRIVTGGFPEPEGNTMIEKKHWMENNYDHVRTALMFEPRGHHDMFGAFLHEPVSKEADFGVMFMDTGGYLNMCGHCTIGAVTVILEAGLIEAKEGLNKVVLEAPAGIIETDAIVKDGKVESVTLTNVPSFVYKENLTVNVKGKEIPYTISFGGSFFALVDTTKIGIPEISQKTLRELTDLGMDMMEIINKEVKIQHPTLDITSVDLVEFYGPTPNPDKATMRNVVIFGEHMADRSPCGTGTSAKLATLHKWGEIKVGEEFIYESFIGSLFKGVIKETTKVGDFDAVIPMITGSSYLTGVATYLIDQDDPLKYGFQV